VKRFSSLSDKSDCGEVKITRKRLFSRHFHAIFPLAPQGEELPRYGGLV